MGRSLGALGLLLATVWLADDKRSVVARNVGAALVLALSVLAVPAVLCCWCPPDPQWWQCLAQPWCCLSATQAPPPVEGRPDPFATAMRD